MKAAISIVICLASQAAVAQSPAIAWPGPAQLVQAHGQFARTQLQAIAAFYAGAPDAAAKEAFQSGTAPIQWSRYAPATGSVARGPTLRESIEPLLANIEAAKSACDALEGPCQAKALAKAKAQAKALIASSNPGRSLANILEEDEWTKKP